MADTVVAPAPTTVPEANGPPAAFTGNGSAPATAEDAKQVPGPSTMGPASSASLYVGDLLFDTTEANLYEVFSASGSIASIRVCRDAITRRSLGYAYVNFHNPVDAERALDALNFTPIRGKACRIMWSQRDPSVRRSGVGNVFIKKLAKTIDNKALYDTFSAFGNILSCKVVQDENGSKGYGFVHFETQQAADSAIEKVNGMLLEDQQVYVARFMSKKERIQEGGDQQTFTNVFVKNIPESIDEDALKKLFEPFGKITSLVVMADADGKSKGFGFVNFETAEEAMKAVEELHTKKIDENDPERELYVSRAQKKGERMLTLKSKFEEKMREQQNKYQGVNLYIKNLDENVDDDMLRNAFGEYGTITSAKVMRDNKGDSRGFGFVCFSSAEEATRAVTEMNSRIIAKKPLYVALAQRKADRQNALAAQRATQLTAMRPMPYPQAPMYYGQPGMPPMYPRGYPVQMRPQRGWTGPQAQVGPNGQPIVNYPALGRGGQMIVPVQASAGGARQQGNNRRSGNQSQHQGSRTQSTSQQGQVSGSGLNRNQHKLTQQVRNAPQQTPMAQVPVQQQPQAAPAAVLAAGQEPLTASALAAATEPQQKQMLGERLYPRIQDLYPERAGKITGMLLEMDNSELLHMLEDESALTAKANEAYQVLRDHQAKGGN